jgi:AraC family L-rhamnose operon regulatory protein RhaS
MKIIRFDVAPFLLLCQNMGMNNAKDVLFKAIKKTLRADDCMPLIQAVQEGSIVLHALARGHYPGDRLKKNEAPGVCSVGFWKATGEQRHGLLPHYNEGIELTVSLQGESPVMVDGKTYMLRPGAVMITRPWQLHAIGDPVFTKGKIGWLILDVGVRHPHQVWQWPEWICLTKGDLATLTRSLRQNEDAIRVTPPDLYAALTRLVMIPQGRTDQFTGSLIPVAVSDVLVQLLHLFHTNPPRLLPELLESSRSVRFYVQKLKQEDTLPQSVEAMADACGLGGTRFSALFKEITGSTPGDYLLKRRLDVARQKLRTHPELSVEEVGRSVGFSHGNYFARMFRKSFGSTPRAWRQRRNENLEGRS